MKIARYAAALVLALAMTIPMAGAIRLVKPTPPKPAEEAETAETMEPAAAVSVEMPKEPEPAASRRRK